MWITKHVDLPAEVLDALQRDRLVLFVGAGASVGAPSNLPPFKQLAIDVGQLARIPYEDQPFDRFLGEVDGLIDVHAQVHGLIARPDSKPNELHEAIVRLATSHMVPRIVTTNFDDHLRAAAVTANVNLGATFYAPALPLGRDFSGVVHLHGTLSQHPSALVVTDRDFGRAYLTDGWATRFLREMFLEYTVMFIGYSHTDPTVEYLSLGLPSRTHRFALTADADLGPWERRGISPIHYPPERGHVALVHALREWSDREHMGLLDHRARIQAIASGLPPKSPTESDYLRARIATPDGANTFEIAASGVEWLEWLDDHEGFRAIFDSGQPDLSTPALERWFCTRFLNTPEGQPVALTTLRKFGQRMSSDLLRSASWSVRALADRGDVVAARRLSSVLLTSVNSGASTAALLGNLGPRDDGLGLQVLRELLRPRLVLRPNIAAEVIGEGPGLPLADLAWPGTAHQVRALTAALRTSGTLSGPAGLDLFESALRAASTLLQEFGGPSSFDSLAFGRSAIEPHPQDTRRAVEDAVVDLLRDLAEEVRPDAGIVDRWIHDEVALIRRLAVHIVNVSDSRPPAAKIEWLVKQNLLFDRATKHETYMLLKQHVSHATSRTKSSVLRQIKDLQPAGDALYTDERTQEYRRFNLAAWLERSDPEWSAIGRLRARLQKRHKFQIREYPDLEYSVTSGVWADRPPLTDEEFRSDVSARGSARAIADLEDREYPELGFNSPTWDGVLQLISSLAAQYPEFGVVLFDGAETLRPSKRNDDVLRAVADGWARSDDEFDPIPVVERLLRIGSAVLEPAASLLSRRSRVGVGTTPEQDIALRAAARTLWVHHHATFSHADDAEASFLSLNSWPADLARFWMNDISRNWRAEGDAWVAIDADTAALLGQMLDGDEPASHAVIAALSGELFFMFSADHSFASAFLMPMFENQGQWRWTWGAYLFNPRWDNGLLRAGLLAAAVAAVPTLNEQLPARVKNQFPQLLASVLAFADLSPEEMNAIVDAFVIETDSKRLTTFIECIGQILLQLPEEADLIWDRSLATQLRRRFNGIPRKLTPDERAAWADLVPALNRNLESAMDVLGTQVVPFNARLELPALDEIDAVRAKLLIKYLVCRVPATPGSVPAGTLWSISDLVVGLKSEFGSDLVEPLVVALASVGQHVITL